MEVFWRYFSSRGLCTPSKLSKFNKGLYKSCVVYHLWQALARLDVLDDGAEHGEEEEDGVEHADELDPGGAAEEAAALARGVRQAAHSRAALLTLPGQAGEQAGRQAGR